MRGAGPFLTICLVLLMPILAIPSLEVAGVDTGPYSVGYHTSFEISEILEVLAHSDPGIAEFTTSQELLGIRSVPGGRTVPLLIMGDKDSERPWVMVVGAHHGDEPDSAEGVLGFARYLMASYGSGDPTVLMVLETTNIAILPVVNPYGLDMNTRTDENGEDPNRDYPFSPEGVTQTSDGIPLTTVGASTVHGLAKLYPFEIGLSYHSGSEGIFTPWGAPGTSNITPDHNCFTDVARTLSKASGKAFQYGPANDFGYLGSIDGAFDDHLYGASFLRDRLYSQEMVLPRSTLTATIELDKEKTKDPERLGSLEGVMTPGGPEDGTVPITVRTALAACMMASPGIWGDPGPDERVDLEITVSGLASMEAPAMEPLPISLSSSEHPFLPLSEHVMTYGAPNEEPVLVEASLVADRAWTKCHEEAYPPISPISLLSRSRGTEGAPRTLHWSGVIAPEEKDGSPLKCPSLGFIGTRPLLPTSGFPAEATVYLDLKGNAPRSLSINASCGLTYALSQFGPNDIADGAGTYLFDLPPASGQTLLNITLNTDTCTTSLHCSVLTLPRIYIMSISSPTSGNQWIDVMIGLDGSDEPAPIVYGIIRGKEASYPEMNWLEGPFVIVRSTDPGLKVRLNISGLGGDMKAVVGPALSGPSDTREVHIAQEPFIPKLPLRRVGERLKVGPVLILGREDGPFPIGPDTGQMELIVTVTSETGEFFSGSVPFVERTSMAFDERAELDRTAMENGIDPRTVNGGYLLNLAIPSRSGNYAVTGWANGTFVTPHSGSVVSSRSTPLTGGIVTIETDEPEEERPFPWALTAFILSVGFLMIVATVLRYKAHWKEPQPERDIFKPHGHHNRRLPLRTSPKGPTDRTMHFLPFRTAGTFDAGRPRRGS